MVAGKGDEARDIVGPRKTLVHPWFGIRPRAARESNCGTLFKLSNVPHRGLPPGRQAETSADETKGA